MRTKTKRMNISSIGIQLVQSGTATHHKSSSSGTADISSNDRVTPSAPTKSSLPAGVGEKVDKIV